MMITIGSDADARFRVPMMPFLSIFAAFGILTACRAIVARRRFSSRRINP
jgi:hypothetical protein